MRGMLLFGVVLCIPGVFFATQFLREHDIHEVILENRLTEPLRVDMPGGALKVIVPARSVDQPRKIYGGDIGLIRAWMRDKGKERRLVPTDKVERVLTGSGTIIRHILVFDSNALP